MKIWWNFQFNYSVATGSPVHIESPKTFHKILAYKIHQAPTQFFSETLGK